MRNERDNIVQQLENNQNSNNSSGSREKQLETRDLAVVY